MALEHTFKTFEVYISKDDADKLRKAILEKAKANNIKTEPNIHFNALLENIRKELINKSKKENYKFSFMGKEANFETNELMFSITVLKELFKKTDCEQINMQSKNLDILSLYGYGVPWDEAKIQKINNNLVSEIKISNTKTNKILGFKPKNKILKPLMFFIFFLLLFSVIYLIFQYYELQNQVSEREFKYQKAIKVYSEQFLKLSDFNPDYYDSILVPVSENIITRIEFDDDKRAYKVYKYQYVAIKSKEGASIKSNPGIKYCEKFGESKAFGFGLRDCISGCYKEIESISYYMQPNSTILRIILDKSYFISYITFNWIEIGHNWGSAGGVYINGIKIGSYPYQYIGIYPPSNMLKDEKVRNYKAKIEEAKYIDILVFDISNESEIFINDIVVYGR